MSKVLKEKWRQVRTSQLGARLVHGASWNMAATVAYRGSILIAMVITARILEKDQFGAFGVIQASIMMFETLGAAGMGVTAAKHIAEYREKHKDRAARIITLTLSSTAVVGLSIAIFLFVFAPWFASNLMSAPHLEDEIRIASLILMLNAVTNAQVGILTGFEAFKFMAFTNAAAGASAIVLITSGAYYGGVFGALCGVAAGSASFIIANSFIIFRLLREHNIPVFLRLTTDEFDIIRKFSFPALSAGLMIAPVSWVGAALLVNEPGGFAEMGIYTASSQWFSVLLFLPAILTSAFLPVFSVHAGRGTNGKFSQLLRVSLKAISVIVFPVAGLVILLSPTIMGLYGPEYVEGWPVLAIIVLAAMAAAVQNMIGNVFAATNRMWLHFQTNAIWAVVYLLVVIVLFEFDAGALALAIAMLVAYATKLLVLRMLIAQYLGKVESS